MDFTEDLKKFGVPTLIGAFLFRQKGGEARTAIASLIRAYRCPIKVRSDVCLKGAIATDDLRF